MSDDIDRAQRINEQLHDDAIIEHFRRGIRNSMYAAELVCKVCGNEIPEARRKAAPGCTRCIGCQKQHELLENWR